jgi:hypothetical protein
MLILVGLLCLGGVYLAVDRVVTPLVVASAVGGYLLYWGFIGLMWVNGHIGVEAFINFTWTNVGGVGNETSGEYFGCPDGVGTNGWVIPALLLGLLTLVVAAVGYAGTPIGGLVFVAGALMYFGTREADLLRRGIQWLAIGLSGILLSAILLRIIGSMVDLMCG